MRSKLTRFIQLGVIAIAAIQSGCGGSNVTVAPGDRTVVDVASNGLYYDASRNRIWSTVGNIGPYANSIVAIDPTNGTITRSIPLGAEPELISITDNGQFAYVSIPSNGTVRRVALSGGSGNLSITTGALASLCTIPGTPNSFGAGTKPNGFVVNVYDDNVKRTGNGTNGNFIRMASPTEMFATNGNVLSKCTLSPGSIAQTFQTSNLIDADFGIYYGLLYDANGHVADPITLTSVGQLSTAHFLPNGRHISLSESDNRAYIVTWDAVINKQILIYDLTTLAELPQRDTGFIPGGAFDIIACGNHTVAFRDFGAIVEPNKIFIFRNLP